MQRQGLGDPQRIALEGYPALLARRITRARYKSDSRSRQTGARRQARTQIVAVLERGIDALRLELRPPLTRDTHIDDGSAGILDAVLCAFQSGWAAQRAKSGYGMPAEFDLVGGWIVGAEKNA